MSRLLVLASALSLLAACERVDYIDLEPATVVFKQPNNKVFMEGKCMARTGVRAIKAKVSWSVADTSVAEVDGKGVLTPKKSGRTEVIAKYGDLVSTAPVEVLFVEKISVEPKELVLVEGQPAAAVAVTAYDYKGRALRDRQPTMMSRDKKVAQIVGGGAVLALDPGETDVDVQVEGQKASVHVKVEKDPKPRK